MFRRLSTALSALSLLLCVAAVVLWGTSLRVGLFRPLSMTSGAGREPSHLVINSTPNGVSVFWWRTALTPADQEAVVGEIAPSRDRPVHEFFRKHGFVLDRTHYDTSKGQIDYAEAGLPHWLIVIALAAAPIRYALRSRRARLRAGIGLCPSCGYDLRATPGRCPECGTSPARKEA